MEGKGKTVNKKKIKKRENKKERKITIKQEIRKQKK